MRLTLFDLDNTLLAGDSDYEWAQYLVDVGALDRAVYEDQNRRFYAQYQDGSLDIHAFLAFALRPLRDHPRATLEAWRADFVRTRIAPRVTPAARRLVEQERARSDLLAIVTATNRFVTQPIADLFGIGALIATEPEEDATGHFTGAVAGLPSFREGKIARVEAWLAGLGRRWSDFDETAFYSDSLNDLPLLSRASQPVAVDPDAVLRRHAEQAGWTILSLREPSST